VKRHLAIFFLLAMAFVGGGKAALGAAGQFSNGRYVGELQFDGQGEKIAVVLDALTLRKNDAADFPQLEVLLRLNLGGYFSSEYLTYSFFDPTFNFEKGVLLLDDPDNELTASLQVASTDSEIVLEGPVVYRPTNAKGKLRLVMELDSDEAPAKPTAQGNFLPVLKGEYSGTCGSSPTKLQIETARGIDKNVPGNGLKGYLITGRLGSADALCSEMYGQKRGEFCNYFPYTQGAYGFESGKLSLQSAFSTLACDRSGESLKCVLHKADADEHCTLSRKSSPAAEPVQYPTGFLLEVPPEQMNPLPEPLPPGNDALMGALDGDFYGFLHYENRDIYQLMRLSVVAGTSTENPHVQNEVRISPSISLLLGTSWDSPASQTTRFSRRVFYLNPGFALESPEADNFAVIGDWRAGYVSGVWYSRTYGRLGTFELRKGSMPGIPQKMAVFPLVAGEYQGPVDGPATLRNQTLVNIGAPGQMASEKELFQLQGNYRMPKAGSATAAFDAAVLDLNTGYLGILLRNPGGDRLVTGTPVGDGKLEILWPVGPGFGAPLSHYDSYLYATPPAGGGK
jgi:hypothetical protein